MNDQDKIDRHNRHCRQRRQQATITLNSNWIFNASLLLAQCTGNASCNVSINYALGLININLLTPLNVNDSLVIKASARLPDDLQIILGNFDRGSTVDFSYADVTPEGTKVSRQQFGYIVANVKGLDVTDGAYFNPSPWKHSEQRSTRFTMSVPFGKATGFYLKLRVRPLLDVGPALRNYSFTITAEQTNLSIAGPPSAAADQISVISSPSDSRTDIQSPSYTITNSPQNGISPSTMALTLSYYLNPNVTKGTQLEFDVFLHTNIDIELDFHGNGIVAGPVLVLNPAFKPSSDIQAGDTVLWQVSIQHQAVVSNEDATDVEILIVLDKYLAITSSPVTVGGVPNGSTYSVSNVNSSTIAVKITYFSLSSGAIIVNGSALVSGQIPATTIGTVCTLNARASYRSVPEAAALSVEAVGYVRAKTSSLSWQPFQSAWTPGLQAAIVATLSLPRGTVGNAAALFEVFDSAGNDLQVSVLSTAISGSTGLGVSPLPTSILNSSGNATVKFSVANLANPAGGPSPAMLSFTVNYLLLASAHLGRSIQSRVTWTLQPESGPLNSTTSTTVAAPVLAISSCSVTPAARVQAGDVLSWSVSVQHAPSSTTWANSVQVIAVLDRYWTGRVGAVRVSGISNFNVSDYNASSIMASVGTFSLTNGPIMVSGQTTVGDNLPVLVAGYTTVLSTLVIYNGVGIQTIPFNSSCTATATSKSINITYSSSTVLPPSPSWAIGQPSTTVVKLSIPRGTLNASFQYVVTTNNAIVPVNVLEPVASGPGVTSTISHGTTPSAISGKRKKRATLTMTYASALLMIVVPGSTNASSVDIMINNTFFPSASATPQATISFTTVLVVSGNSTILGNTATKILAPSLSIAKTSELQASNNGDGSVQTVRYTIVLHHDSTSSCDAGSIVVSDFAQGMVLLDSYMVVPNTSVLTFPNEMALTWRIDSLPLGQTATIWYLAQPAGDQGRNLPVGSTPQEADLTYSTNAANAIEKPSYTGQSKTCVVRNDISTKTYWSDHGYTVLLVFIGVVGGVAFVILITVIIILLMKKFCSHAYESSVEPISSPELDRNFKSKTKIGLDSIGKALKKGFNSLQDITHMTLEDSIVKILALRDRLRIGRELDCLDIKAAARADQQLEKARLDSLLSALDALLHGMVLNGDVKQRVLAEGRSKLRSSLEHGNKTLDHEYEKMLFRAQKTVAVKSKRALEEAMRKHKMRKDQVLEKAQDIKSKDVNSILRTIDDECDAELEELSSVSRLQQEEEAEKLRKELALRKRIQLKEHGQQLIQFVASESRLASEQAQWLIQKHKENQAAVEKMHDDRQLQTKLLLEEKLAKRRMLAEAHQADSDGHVELLNQVAGGQIDMLKRAKKIGVLTAEELKGMTQDEMGRMAATKQVWERERARQEAELHQKLCQHKQKLLEAKEKENQIQLDALGQQQRQRLKVEAIDPLSLETEKLELLAKQDADSMELESRVDAESAEELSALQGQLVEKAKNELLEQGKRLGETMKKEGMADKQVDAILAEHDESIQRLKELQQSQREKLESDLQAKLQQRRREWRKSIEEEQAEQVTLRQQEDQVLQDLMAKQIAMSDEDRDKIIKEHEQNLAKLENSLTFSRLQQRRILEEKLAQRRAAKIEKLEQEQLIEQKKTLGKRKNETDDERLAAEITLLKKQADERLEASKRSDDISLDEEMEKVKLEIMAERAKQLREQEDHIGSLLVSLQLSKAKELSEIDEKQKAIYALTTNLMDDLTDRGILSDPECQKVIEKHQMDQEKLIRKLDEERDKQERMLKSKLALKLQQREKSMIAEHEDKLRSVIKGTKAGAAALLRRAAIMARNKAEIEDFRVRMETEISQTLEDMRRQQLMRKRRLIQELEMRFVAGLIKLGKLQKSELVECLHILFPSKTAAELDQLIASLHDDSNVAAADDQQMSSSEEDLLTSSSASMLKDRIQRAVLMSRSSLGTVREEESEQTAAGDSKERKKKPAKSKQPPQPIPTESDEEMLVPVKEHRPVKAALPGGKNSGKDEASEQKSQRNKSASSVRKDPEQKEAAAGWEQPKALPPLKSSQPRRTGPNSSMDHLT